MAEQLDRLGMRVVFNPFTIEDLLTALRETLTARELLAAATEAMSGGDERGEGTRTQPGSHGRVMDTTRRQRLYCRMSPKH